MDFVASVMSEENRRLINETGMQHMSETFFMVLCEIVGTSQLVAFRREIKDIKEEVERRATPYDGVTEMISGSYREGFRLKGSDLDIMYWLNNHRVIMDMSQSEYYNTANTTLILANRSASPPGFTLLELLTSSRYVEVNSACNRINDRVYISSSKFRQSFCRILFPNSIVHGPCSSGDIAGSEYDNAWCFVCDFWPPSASPWIDRCHSWPDPEVVNDIVRNGCHFVAIGHPLGPNENGEWRISFSQAEQKCVYAMNHSQFLTYGILKLFLKEVINHQIDTANRLLCSYHIKTAVFWAIQQNTQHQWCPKNFLAGFWICFKLLLKWVYEGICPNFFIPQNNMFLTKVYGSSQNRLFLQLHELYEKGLACLLLSNSLKSYIIDIQNNSRLFLCTDENVIKPEVDYDVEFFDEIYSVDNTQMNDFGSSVKYFYTHEQLIGSPLTKNEIIMLQRLTAIILRRTAFVLHNIYKDINDNKQMYVADKLSCHMLKLSAKFGFVSDLLYIAIYYYKTRRYREALYVIKMAKVKLAQPFLMYNKQVDRESYTEAVGGQSWSTKMRHAVAVDIVLNNEIYYILELIPEQKSAIKNRWPILYIPVFVMLYFLEFLCYRHIDTTLSQAALDKLQGLVHNDQGHYAEVQRSDISWEILGICQQITGNSQAALYSYQQSLKQYPWNNIQTATQRRIQNVNFG